MVGLQEPNNKNTVQILSDIPEYTRKILLTPLIVTILQQ